VASLHQDSTSFRAAAFGPTQWSMVLRAGDSDGAEANLALDQLCRTYWQPLYGFVRRQGHSAADAEDLTQQFFEKLLVKNYLASVDPAKGKFRSFLLSSMKHFLANEWDRAHAQKRGGYSEFVSLDAEDGMEVIADSVTPEFAFDLDWAMAVMERVLTRLSDYYAARGEADTLAELQKYLTQSATDSYASSAAKLGVDSKAIVTAVYKMRKRSRELLYSEIGRTVGSMADIESERRYLLSILAR
jgi:RNA polymerase sigma-70 factor (ECF subfamily)